MIDQNIWTLIISWGTIQCFVLTIILLFKKQGNYKLKLILACILFIVGFQSFNFLYSYFDWYKEFPHLIWVSSPFWFLIGPFIYLFERYSTSKHFKLKPIHLTHLLPFLFGTLYISKFYFLDGDSKIYMFDHFYSNYEDSPDYYFYIFIISQLIYGIVTYINFKNYFSKVGDEYSRDSIYNYKWVLVFILSFNLFWLLTLSYHLLLLTNFDAFFPYDYFTYTFLTIFVQAFGISAAINPDAFFITPLSDSVQTTSDLNESLNIGEDVKEILDFMDNKKPYLNPELRINDLSRMIDIPVHRLSYIINNYTDKNFFEFVNEYRIEEVKKRLPDPSYSNLTLDAIARESGFNSSASFYRVFKQSTGLTPKQFLKNAS